jgi:hypothetical protein
MNDSNNQSTTYKDKVTAKSFFKDLAVASLMLGLLMAFNKLIKFTTLFIQEFSKLFSQLTEERAIIARGSKVIIDNEIDRPTIEHYYDLNVNALFLSNQLSNDQTVIFAMFLLIIVAFISADASFDDGAGAGLRQCRFTADDLAVARDGWHAELERALQAFPMGWAEPLWRARAEG